MSLNGLNKVLRLGGAAPKVTSAQATIIPASALPEWVKVGSMSCYVSQSNGETHTVKIKTIEERKQTVLIVFEADKRIWKRVPFSGISKTGDGMLRPVWKAPAVAAPGCAPRPVDDVAEEIIDDDVVEVIDKASASSGAKADKKTSDKRDRSRSPRR
eukprot:TRINITY_DN52576_c0_g1_i1.p1 TRINITY_DN52576_c0_g1~~TRINITY_DN52576_c0_g1_i1.p1  ORF type:complete len:181 (-),score=22.98 TRINITY_DN52576_c0_g1_i1:85-555(-)